MTATTAAQLDDVDVARATAEQLPVCTAAVDLVTAAGSLNGAHLPSALDEIARVLRPAGGFVAYDFALGRRIAGSSGPGQWVDRFLARWPKPSSSWAPLESSRLVHPDLATVHDGPLEVVLTMTRDRYVDYLMTESNVTVAVASGTTPDAIRSWCASTLPDAFGPTEDVVFDATLTCARRR
jgi:SAM-dependent methyltransferase